MTIQAPNYGQENQFSMGTPAFLQLWGTAVNAKPATLALAKDMFRGVKSAATYVPKADGSVDDEYTIFNTPQTRYCFYVKTAPTPATLYDVAVPVTAWTTAAAGVANIIAAATPYKDILITNDATTVTLTAKNGGLTVTNSETGTSFAFSGTPVDGAGAWLKFGKLADTIDITTEENMMTNSEKEDTQMSVKFNVAFDLINVSQRAWEVCLANWNNVQVNVAFVDETNDKYPVYIINNIPLRMLPDFMNKEGARINFKANKTYEDYASYIQFWQF